MIRRLGLVLALSALAGGCGIIKSGDGRTRTAVLGERIPVLSVTNDAVADASLADVPVVIPPATVNPAWGQPGGDAAKTLGNVALSATPRQAWSASFPGGDITQRIGSTPAVAGGKLYVIGAEAVVHAYDAKTGARLWQTSLGGTKRDRKVLFGGGVSVEGDRVFATTGRGDAAALDAQTGKLIWKVRPGGPLRGAPAIGGGNIYVLSQDNQLFALKPENGETAWTVSATLQTSGVFGVAPPAYAQQTLVAGFSSGELSAIRYENGRVVWQDQLSRTSITTSVSTISDIDAAPVIAEGKVYAIGQGGRMVSLDLLTGQRQWELTVGGISMPWLAGEWLFVVTDDAKLLCVARTTGKIRWVTQLTGFRDPKKRNKPISWFGPVLAGGRLLLVNSIGQLLTVTPETGQVGTPVKAGNDFYLPPIVADNMMYLVDGKGRITAWR
jgi:outer membrane protein assembly factor BamB